MPAIMTHDFFGQDVYARLEATIGSSQDERDAFLLGNQGPDPLFYSVVLPQYKQWHRFGSTMHREKPSELMSALKQSIDVVAEDEKDIARAYALGFLCHYLLDSTVHPLVYTQQYAICDAGEPGLDRRDGNDVHAVIEREFDEMLLYTRTGQTIATFKPYKEILRASNHVLNVISKQYLYVALVVYGLILPKPYFRDSVLSFRSIQHILYSSEGTKRSTLSQLERGVRLATGTRHYSFYGAMSHENVKREESAFENREHAEWTHPFVGTTHTESFQDLYAKAQERVQDVFTRFLTKGFSVDDAREITGDINFNGDTTEARLLAVE